MGALEIFELTYGSEEELLADLEDVKLFGEDIPGQAMKLILEHKILKKNRMKETNGNSLCSIL